VQCAEVARHHTCRAPARRSTAEGTSKRIRGCCVGRGGGPCRTGASTLLKGRALSDRDCGLVSGLFAVVFAGIAALIALIGGGEGWHCRRRRFVGISASFTPCSARLRAESAGPRTRN